MTVNIPQWSHTWVQNRLTRCYQPHYIGPNVDIFNQLISVRLIYCIASSNARPQTFAYHVTFNGCALPIVHLQEGRHIRRVLHLYVSWSVGCRRKSGTWFIATAWVGMRHGTIEAPDPNDSFSNYVGGSCSINGALEIDSSVGWS